MKYEIEVKIIESYIVKVEATDQGQAECIAWDAVSSKNGRMQYHNDSDVEFVTTEE